MFPPLGSALLLQQQCYLNSIFFLTSLNSWFLMHTVKICCIIYRSIKFQESQNNYQRPSLEGATKAFTIASRSEQGSHQDIHRLGLNPDPWDAKWVPNITAIRGNPDMSTHSTLPCCSSVITPNKKHVEEVHLSLGMLLPQQSMCRMRKWLLHQMWISSKKECAMPEAWARLQLKMVLVKQNRF